LAPTPDRVRIAVSGAAALAWPAAAELLMRGHEPGVGATAVYAAAALVLARDVVRRGPVGPTVYASAQQLMTLAFPLSSLLKEATGNRTETGHSRTGSRLALAGALAVTPLMLSPSLDEGSVVEAGVEAASRALLHSGVAFFALAVAVSLERK